jgi:DNA helicase-2/ATP-dependent DNA helicase PcrA
MPFYADLHIHSKYSRATSKQCDLEHLTLWARKKGITVVGTGDFTHPAWLAELQDKLTPAEPGLFRLRPDLERAVIERLPPACHGTTRFMLSVEISTIYKKDDHTRKIHHLIYVPDFAAAERVIQSLSKIGNLASDGRPILGLDSRHLLEIVLQTGSGSYLVPAHIWTPWFAALGSKSGFDAIDHCYADLAPHIFAVETGLSSDPPMNWRVSSLDRYRLVSNSDAHSPDKLGREACVFATDLDFFAIREALETGQGYQGTVEFFPEEGKYHLDGHRNCNVRLSPRETREHDGRCPVCGKPVTVGVMHRVEELADRAHASPPATSGSIQSLVPLPEVLSEIHQVGARSKTILRHYEHLLGRLGPELTLLNDVPLDDIQRLTSPVLAEAIARLRTQQVIREAGFDGEYGTIRLFQPHELRQHTAGTPLFADAEPLLSEPPAFFGTTATQEPTVTQSTDERQPACHTETTEPSAPAPRLATDHSSSPDGLDTAGVRFISTSNPTSNPLEQCDAQLLAGLDDEQRRAVMVHTGPLLIVAGPGAGKTRTLTHRIAHLISHYGVPAASCLAITFARRAADEMRARLHTLLPDVWKHIGIFTFHALGLTILQEHYNMAGLQRGFRVATAAERSLLLQETLDLSERRAGRLLTAISHAKRRRTPPEEARVAEALQAYQGALEARNLVDYDDLVGLAADVLEADAGLQAAYQKRYPWVFIDEYQDIDQQQVRLLKRLVPPHGNVCAIGDPAQAIYGFRGADVRFFARFHEDFPSAHTVHLRRNYRSDRTIVTAADQLMARTGTHHPSVSALEVEPNRITIHEAPTEDAEAEFIVQTVERLIGGHSFFSIDSGRAEGSDLGNLSFADIAVLYRTDAQLPALVKALSRSGMPFQQRSHTPLMEHPGVARLTDLMLAARGSGALSEWLEAVVRPYRQGGETSSAQEAATLLEAFELVKPLALACSDDLERFLAELELSTQVDTWDPRADRIALLTLHASKGLEFPVVFIVGCEDGLLPLRWGKADDTALDEERRLFYVGITRARTRLYLCHARKRLWHGRVRPMAPSPYLDDLEAQLLHRQRTQLQGKRSMLSDTQLELF